MNEIIKEYLFCVMKELEKADTTYLDEEDEEVISLDYLESILFRCVNKVGGKNETTL